MGVSLCCVRKVQNAMHYEVLNELRNAPHGKRIKLLDVVSLKTSVRKNPATTLRNRDGSLKHVNAKWVVHVRRNLTERARDTLELRRQRENLQLRPLTDDNASDNAVMGSDSDSEGFCAFLDRVAAEVTEERAQAGSSRAIEEGSNKEAAPQ